MLSYPEIDPVLLAVGPLKVHWYGVMYVLGFAAAWWLVMRQITRFGYQALAIHLDNLNLFLLAGVILGGRIGYALFYQSSYYLQHPLEIFFVWNGGMSFHGGCLGVLIAGLWYCHRHQLDFWRTADLYVVTIPVGLGLGRLGNFINGELYGRVTDVSWGMIFPGGGPLPRHPSQLYEALLEGVVLFCLLWGLKGLPYCAERGRFFPHGTLLALFLIAYAVVRFPIEFVRQPDQHLGLVLLGMTMGQLLCLAMLVLGTGLWLIRLKQV